MHTNDTPTARSTETLSSSEVAELAPWWLNGTLDADERAAIDASVSADAECRDELQRTALVVSMATTHPSTVDLVEYALDMEPGSMEEREPLDRAILERHLAECSACRREVAMIRGEETMVDVDFGAVQSESKAPVDAEPATPSRRTAERRPRRAARRRAPVRRFLATAAGLVLVVTMGSWLGANLEPTIDVPTMAALESAPSITGVGEATPETTSTPDVGLFFDGFESGDTGTWSVHSGS